jgi:hypothetical protein
MARNNTTEERRSTLHARFIQCLYLSEVNDRKGFELDELTTEPARRESPMIICGQPVMPILVAAYYATPLQLMTRHESHTLTECIRVNLLPTKAPLTRSQHILWGRI